MFNNGIPAAYPLAISGLGVSSNDPNYLQQRLSDLTKRNAIGKAEIVIVQGLIKNGRSDEARGILAEKERLASRGSFSKVEDLFDWIPEGYKFHQELIAGVPNWTLYLGAGVAGALGYRALKKRRK